MTYDVVTRLGPAGLRWRAGGHAAYRGPLLELLHDCDRALLALAESWGAEEERHPVAIAAAALDRIDYLDSFPHLATLAAALDDDEANLEAFRAGEPVGRDGAVRLTRLAPVRDVLTPAACYHLYVEHAGEALAAPLHLTTRNTCFRREVAYVPLRRQHSFEMRELVCLGPRDDVVAFLARARRLVDGLLGQLDVPVAWEVATDPFFQPRQSPQRLFQRMYATKHEAVYGDGDGAGLAIASVNLHEDHFGAAFEITSEGSPVSSGCVGLGLDRWLFALTDRHGPDPARWPDVPAAAGRALADDSVAAR